MPDSHVTISASGGFTFSGPDAVALFRAITLKSALLLYSKGIRATRNLSATQALAMATGYTGKRYKRGEHAAARADLDQWIEAMKAAIPIERTE